MKIISKHWYGLVFLDRGGRGCDNVQWSSMSLTVKMNTEIFYQFYFLVLTLQSVLISSLAVLINYPSINLRISFLFLTASNLGISVSPIKALPPASISAPLASQCLSHSCLSSQSFCFIVPLVVFTYYWLRTSTTNFCPHPPGALSSLLQIPIWVMLF